MDAETLITVDHVTRYFGKHCAVSDISFKVQRGEILGFLGPNGAGKSTTMQIICGVLSASSGEVIIAGNNIADKPILAKKHIGYLPEHPPLYLDQTVDEYLYYCACLRSIDKQKLGAAMMDSKQRCGLEEVGHRLIGNLSKGYQQRVGIAQAIIHNPAVIILDEPTVGLDPLQIMEIRQLICELGQQHSVILSTHILPEVQTTCNRVVIINNGQLVLDEHTHMLAADKHHGNMTIALRRPPALEEIESIDGITEVKLIDRNRYRINYDLDKITPESIAQTAMEFQWHLYELIPASDALEETFVQLTRGEAAVDKIEAQQK